MHKAAKDVWISGEAAEGKEKKKKHTFLLSCLKLKGVAHLSKLSDSTGLGGIEPTENPSCCVRILIFYSMCQHMPSARIHIYTDQILLQQTKTKALLQ